MDLMRCPLLMRFTIGTFRGKLYLHRLNKIINKRILNMDIKEELKKFQDKINPELKKFFNETIISYKENDFIIIDALNQVKKITLGGGKRLRPALMYWGYRGVGGKKEEEIIRTSVSIELIHIFLLIHDDVIDKDKSRHGKETIHSKYAMLGKNISKDKRDSVHFGNSMGIVVGDIVGALGNKVIYTSDFPAELIVKSLSKLQSIIYSVAVGEAQDVFIEHKRFATEEEVLNMYKNKTAKYTIEGPLHLGAILGGAPESLMGKISKFSIPIGVAFQIQDDILGVFGNEKKLGKPVGSDIREGKQTILVVKAMEKADNGQKKTLLNLLGKENINKQEIEEFKKIIEDTGSLDYSNNLAKKLIEDGKRELENITDSEFSLEAKEFLRSIADYMTQREI